LAPVWLGLFTVTAPKDNTFLRGNAGACVWAAAQAEDAAKLQMRVGNTLRELGLTVVEAEHLQIVEDDHELSEAQAALIPEASRNVESVVYGTWHKFKYHDA
jgi:hypothetical protein